MSPGSNNPNANLITVGAHWLSANLHSVPLGVDAERLGCRSRTCIILLRLDERSSWLGFPQGLPDSQAISHDA